MMVYVGYIWEAGATLLVAYGLWDTFWKRDDGEEEAEDPRP